MSNKAVVDSNVWIYLKSQDTAKRDKAEALLRDATLDIYISTQILGEVYTVLTKKRFSCHTESKTFVTALSSFYPIMVLTREHVVEALKLVEEYSFSYWDALVVATALLSDSEILYSEDMQDGLFVRNKVTITNPFKRT